MTGHMISAWEIITTTCLHPILCAHTHTPNIVFNFLVNIIFISTNHLFICFRPNAISFQDDQPPSADSFKNLGSIRIDAVEAVDTGIKEYYYQSHFRPVTDENYPLQSCLRTLKHASKKDVMKITKGSPLFYLALVHNSPEGTTVWLIVIIVISDLIKYHY